MYVQLLCIDAQLCCFQLYLKAAQYEYSYRDQRKQGLQKEKFGGLCFG